MDSPGERLPLPPDIYIGMEYLIASDLKTSAAQDGVYIGRLEGRSENTLIFADISDRHLQPPPRLLFHIEDHNKGSLNLTGNNWWYAVPLIACRIKTPMYWWFCPSSQKPVELLLKGQEIHGLSIIHLDDYREDCGHRALHIADRINSCYNSTHEQDT